MAGKKIQKLKLFFIALCVFQLLYIFHFRSGFKYEVLKDPFGKDSGIIYALSPEIIELNDILKDQQVVDFNLSDKLKTDTYFYQRSIEFSYPIKINEKSDFVFFLKEEAESTGCKTLEKRKYLKFAKC